MHDKSSPIVKEFLLESFENLSNINEELTHFEKNSGDSELLNSIYRKVHTLKGSASFLGLKVLQHITHLSENILDKIREQQLSADSTTVDVLLESFDACIVILNSIESTGDEGSETFDKLLEKLERLDSGEAVEIEDDIIINDEDNHEIDLSFKEKKFDEDLMSSLNELEDKIFAKPVNAKNDIEEKKSSDVLKLREEKVPVEDTVKNIDEVAPGKNSKLRDKIELLKNELFKKNEVEVQDVEGAKVEISESKGNLVDSVVRVNVALLDKIMNVVGELVLNRNQILQCANQDTSPELSRLAHQLNAITTELQTDIMTTRMQPVGSVLSKFERVVRDISRQQEKSIKLNITGKETELDKTLLEAIRDPLTHLVRNAVDHGIEKPESRVANGKPEIGTINIRAYHEGGQVTIEISDDGNGIDPEKILNKAIAKGILSKEKAERLSKKQILNIIFSPGFSTAEAVTNISGRGVGMDVVKSNIEKIGGSVDIHSNVGEGTIFKLKIPLTLAIVPALVVESANETFAIPQISLVELVRIEEGEDKKIELIHESEFFRLRGDLIPVFRLNHCLNLESDKELSGDINIVILNAEGHTYGLIVDQVLDTEEIVVKPLSKELKELSIYGGATIMGDGSVSLIIDALGFFNTVGRVSNQKKIDGTEKAGEKLVVYNDEILLCTLEDRREYGIPLMLVNRLEEFKREQVEWSGNSPLVRYRNKAMPLISLEKILGIKTPSILDGTTETIPAVVVSVRGHQIAFAVSEIKDIAINQGPISTETADRDEFVGTAFINEKTITILDLFNIIDSLPLKQVKKEKTHGNILVVEDSQLYLRVQKELYTEAGYAVCTAMNGSEALSILDTEKIDVIVTDIDMPIMTGWEMIRKLKGNTKYVDIPVIAVSSIVSKKREEITRAGFDFCFDKQQNGEALKIVNKLMEL
ncbi:chemotaxis protein CheW [Bacteriovorax sp. Seq25_V]|uniref:hybrid sensor histidine kinase/response regulator n=1 Tax=Bacteriovorax sp. Seq25_V TaxID=1201288 RepID=UPI00038A4932|nr:chemotaxis protein CheW [Bacteriovorax sp. Seq25_V]EQC47450.1 chemotaxis protein CheA family protein [Bacteriovorax sp. Seq25_V]